MKTMIIYYSRADENYFGGTIQSVREGNTEKVARIIAELTGAPLFKLEQKEPYAADYHRCTEQAKADKNRNVRPELVALPEIGDVERVYLGYPNYWGTMPMAVYTLLEALDWTGKSLYPFCTHEGSGLSGTEKDIARASKGARVEHGLAIQGSAADRSRETVEKWIQRCREAK